MWTALPGLILSGVLLAAARPPGQIRSREGREPSLRVSVNLVLVPVTVTDRSGRIVGGLERDRFRVFEEGIPQRIVAFGSEDIPASLGLVLDLSGSMKQKIGAARSSVRALLSAADREDEALLVTCAGRPSAQAGFTAAFDSIEETLKAARPGGRTALIDAVYLALGRMQPAAHPRKALVVISDGQDNNSRYSKRELLAKAVEADVQIYTVGIYDPPRHKKAIELVEENVGIALLADLARQTGGLHFVIGSVEEAPAAVQRISLALHHQYLLGYYADSKSRGTGWRRIQVKLDMPGARPYSRTRYFAPAR